jgi:ubiquitin-like modifier-activating enzyme ATG7
VRVLLEMLVAELKGRPPPGSIPIKGIFKNFNTIEEFKSTEHKKALFDSVADKILASFDTDAPDLNPFLLVTFADLKKYVYYYWFAFPALVAKPGWEAEGDWAEDTEEVSFVRVIHNESVQRSSRVRPWTRSTTCKTPCR